jgi:hypothetical protein
LGFVQFKNRHKLHKEIDDPKVGDAYTFVGIERDTKLILAAIQDFDKPEPDLPCETFSS